ncbi:unnamed protein product, partial [Hapterophycus canaliculatus]
LYACRLGSCAANYCEDRGGVLYNDACFVFADPGVSCTDRCSMEGVLCDEDALDMSNPECEGALAALGVDIASTTSNWYYNFGNPDDDHLPTFFWTVSYFDENRVHIREAPKPFLVAGCIVSPTYDATDQDSFVRQPSMSGNFPSDTIDAAEANNLRYQPPPTCGGSSLVYRRVCACLFPTPSPTPSPTTPSPSQIPTPSPTPSPTTPFPSQSSTLRPTPSPTLLPKPTPTPSSSTPYPTSFPSWTLIPPGYWRTSQTSTDIRVCPIPHLCKGGFGGADDICVGDNTGPYCLVCPSSHFASESGVCLACGSPSGMTAIYIIGLILAVCILLGAFAFAGPIDVQARGAGEEDRTPRMGTWKALNAQVKQQSGVVKLTEKLMNMEIFVERLRRDVLHTLPQPVIYELEYLLVTIDLYTSRLIRLLPREPNPLSRAKMEKTILQAELLCPVIDQLASALAGLSGTVAGEEATVVLQIKSSLATARALDPSTDLQCPTSNVANAMKVVLSFAQIVAAMPFVMAMRRAKNVRSFLGGFGIVNFSVPKVLSSACLVQGNFYDELVFKTMGPLVMAAVISGVQVILRSSSITWRSHSLRCNGCLLAIAYCVLTPATNAALRAFPCETFEDGRTLLRADYSIDCDAAEHMRYRALGITFALAYPIGSSALFSGVLFKHRDALYPLHIHRRSKEDNAIAHEAKRVNALELQMSSLLHDAYHPRAWWYEMFETFRRILLTCLVLFVDKTSMQLWTAMSFTVLSLAINVVFSPFVNITDDIIYSGAQMLTLALIAVALLTEADVGCGDDETATSLGWVVIVLMTGYIMTAFLLLILRWGKRS